MKKLGTVLVLCLMLMSVLLGYTFCVDNTFRALTPTKLYNAMSFDSETKIDIPQNQSFDTCTKINDYWYQVSVLGQSGYVDARAVYSTSTTWEPSYKTMKVDAGGFDEEVNLYYYPYMDSKVYTTLKDNVELEVAEGGVDYGDFAQVKYEGKTYYILNKDITTSLTYSQIVAIILGIVGGILLLTLAFLLIYGFRLKLR